MESRKRARLEPMAASIDAGVDADSGAATARLTGTHSIFLSDDATGVCGADAVGVLPGNVFLTICDENSDESQDYLAIDDQMLTHIKQEQHLLDSVPAATSLPLQYRIVNQLQRQLPQLGGNSTAALGGISTTTSGTVNSQLTPMQLPSGCEIYLVKEFANNGTPTTTTIKIEPDSGVAAVAGGSDGGGGGSEGGGSVQYVRGAMPCVLTPKLTLNNSATPIISAATTTTATTTTAVAAAAAGEEGNANGNCKRSYILEAYKKRDDKRRATHNEVERRRRDKINNWIFKLKEMLPPEMSNQNNVNNNNNNSTTKNASTNTNANSNNAAAPLTNDSQQQQQQQQQPRNATNNNNSNHSRTPPSDSKSQILIKACEYIKAMQDEIKSLRECLTENERLRLSNQRLQNELNKLKSANKNGTATSNSNFNIALNSLNNAGIGSAGGVLFCTEVTPGNGGGPCTSTNTYTKRELIIRDYVD